MPDSTSMSDIGALDLPGAVLFDMDGTLIDSEPLWLTAEIEVMDELGGQWSQADQQHCLGGPLERVVEYMVNSSGTTRSGEDVGRRLLDRMTSLLRETPLVWKPGARELLRESVELEVPRALVTASWGVLVDAVFDRMQDEVGANPFHVVVTGDRIENGKPHPEPYQRAARDVGSPPALCLAIEDSPTGVRSATAAGCVVVAVPHLTNLPADIAGVLVVDGLDGWSIARLWTQALSGWPKPGISGVVPP